MTDWTTCRVVRDRDGDLWFRGCDSDDLWTANTNYPDVFLTTDEVLTVFGPLTPVLDADGLPVVPTHHETPPALLDALLAMNAAIDQFVAAKAAIESAARDLEAIRVSRLDHMDLDWSEPEHMWLNAFACIRPTDEFAAQVGHGVIRAAMQAHPKRATFTVNAS